MNTPGQNANAVAELVFGMTLGLTCTEAIDTNRYGQVAAFAVCCTLFFRSADCFRMIVSARNNFDGTSGFELVNREIAFYGFGAVARAVHKLAQGFGMKSFAYDPYIPADKIKARILQGVPYSRYDIL